MCTLKIILCVSIILSIDRTVSITALFLILCSTLVGSVILQNASSPPDTEELNVISEETRRSLVYHDIFIADMMSMQPTFMINTRARIPAE